MGRSTQYIGLNDYALEFVKRAVRVEEKKIATGMFDEPIYGKVYYLPAPEGPNKEWIFEEVVQIDPWSSGPMIFTMLKGTLVKNDGFECDPEEYFQWMCDPSLLDSSLEFDRATGRYYL